MLNLKRRVGEEIIINERIRIIVKKAGPKNCEIAIEAPLTDNIRRGEIAPESEQVIIRAAGFLGVPK